MSELKQYHPNLRAFRIKQTQHGRIFIDFVILQSEPKMQQVFGKNVKVSLYPRLIILQTPQKEKVWFLREHLTTLH